MEEKKITLFNLSFIPYHGLVCTPAALYLMQSLLAQGYSFLEALFFCFCLLSVIIFIPTSVWLFFRQKILRHTRQTKRKWLLKYVDFSD